MARKPSERWEDKYGFVAQVATRMIGVSGELQKGLDVLLTGSFAKDRVTCERAIQEALEEMSRAGEGADEDGNAYELAWAYDKLERAYTRLGQVVARHKLAERRLQLKEKQHEQT